MKAAQTQPLLKHSFARQIIGRVLVTSVVFYIGLYIFNNRLVLIDTVQDVEFYNIALAVCAVTMMVAGKTAYHVVALRRVSHNNAELSLKIALAYSISQVVRYLPGKILGVVYEANRLAGAISTQQIITANLVQMLFTNAMSIGVLASVAVWIALKSIAAALGLLAIAVSLVWCGHRFHLAERVITNTARVLPRLRNLPHVPPGTKHWAFTGSIILLLEWIPYFSYWTFLLPSNINTIPDALLLGSCYAAASFAANLVLVMPSGLIIREALFLWVGTQLSIDPATLIVLGALSRLLFTLGDLVLIPLVWFLARLVNYQNP
jgi:hypothetical protein